MVTSRTLVALQQQSGRTLVSHRVVNYIYLVSLKTPEQDLSGYYEVNSWQDLQEKLKLDHTDLLLTADVTSSGAENDYLLVPQNVTARIDLNGRPQYQILCCEGYPHHHRYAAQSGCQSGR